MSVAVLGCGLIGGSLLRALAPHLPLIAVDPDPAVRELIRAHLGLDAHASLSPALAACDVIVLAQPVPQLLATLPLLAPFVTGRDVVVTDVGGIKEPVLHAAARSLPGVAFVGGHPMAGKEQAGFAASDAQLFRGRTIALCPAPGADRSAVERVASLWRTAGGLPLECDAAEHDRAVARISHLPHLTAAALALVAGRGDSLSDRLAASGLRDSTRVAEDPTVRHAATRNRHLPALVREAAEELLRFAEALETEASVDERLDTAAAARRRIYPR